MVKKLIQHGNGAALIIEQPILQLLNIDMDTNLEIVTDGKSIIISPIANEVGESAVLQSLAETNARHRNTLANLAK